MEDRETEFQSILASQGELVGSISHDLKGLLNGIDGGVYLVDSGLKNEKKERIDQGFEMVKRNLSRIRRTVSNILYFVKDREVDWAQLNINDIAAMIIKEFKVFAEHLGVELKVEAEEGSFECGEYPVSSLLLNLVEFSLQACNLNKASSPQCVTLFASLKENQVIFDLLANGFCIESNTIESSRSPYYSPHGADRSHLGLYISNKLVQCLNGTLDIESSTQEGSTRFTIKLPKVKPSE